MPRVTLLMPVAWLLGSVALAATPSQPTSGPISTPTAPTGSQPAPAPAPLSKADAKSIVAYRALLMVSMGKDMNLANMVAGGQVNRPADLLGYATALQAASLTDLFPPGTGPDAVDTGAKKELWSNPAGFTKAVAAYQTATAAVTAAAQAGDMPAAKLALGQVGESCSGCHDLFRVED